MNRSIDERYKIHAALLLNKKDLAEMEARLIRWVVASALGASVSFVFLAKLTA